MIENNKNEETIELIIPIKKDNKVNNIDTATNKVIVKKRKLKKYVLQNIFIFLSILMILTCFIYYGRRLIKYYKIYNPTTESGEKVNLLSTAIFQKSQIVTEGDGLYNISGRSTYKGENVNNYIKFSNLTWRIVHTNSNGSVDIILDDYINILALDKENKPFIESDVNKYLNDEFLSILNKEYLEKTTICKDIMENISTFTCNEISNEYYVKLLGANDFLNSQENNKTYILKDKEVMWLGTSNKDDISWLANYTNLSSVKKDSTYPIKPVITIKSTTPLISGTGTKEDPFIIEKENNKLSPGEYIKLNNDLWIIYENKNDTLKLVSDILIGNGSKTYRYDLSKNEFDINSKDSLAEYLNTKLYNSLSYKDLLIDFDIYTGEYNKSYKDIYEKKTTAKVGIQNITDFKFNNELNGYFLSTPSVDKTIYYFNNNDIVESKVGISRTIRPTIAIKKTNIKSGKGTKHDPYVLEVK